MPEKNMFAKICASKNIHIPCVYVSFEMYLTPRMLTSAISYRVQCHVTIVPQPTHVEIISSAIRTIHEQQMTYLKQVCGFHKISQIPLDTPITNH